CRVEETDRSMPDGLRRSRQDRRREFTSRRALPPFDKLRVSAA
ncbi:MAG: hypothetical protein AVDCRST_MAG31-1518, partial [uncultured Sphingomonas sp.]